MAKQSHSQAVVGTTVEGKESEAKQNEETSKSDDTKLLLSEISRLVMKQHKEPAI